MASERPQLNFPAVRPRARHTESGIEVWDSLRGIWLCLTPEEWVRRHVINFLITHCNIPSHRVVQEFPVMLNGQSQRADIVAVDDLGQPLLLVECKAPSVAINQKVLDQAVRYNSVVQARWLILTNGMKHYCYIRNGIDYTPCDFPRF